MRHLKLILLLISIFLITTIHLVAADTNDASEQVEVNTKTITIIIILAILTGFFPLMLGYFTVKVMEENEKMIELNFVRAYGISFGFSIFLLYDYLNLSGLFSLNRSNLLQHIGIVIAFLLSLIFFITAENSNKIEAVYLWAIGMGIHSFSEGIIIGFNFSLGLAASFSFLPLISFIIHKIIEGFIGATIFLGRSKPEYSQLIKLSMISALPIVGGVLVGYILGGRYNFANVGRLTLFLFASSVAAIIFILPQISLIIDHNPKTITIYYKWIIFGLLIFFFSVVLHNF